MEPNQWILIRGNFNDGFYYVGPFDSFEAAIEWGQANEDGDNAGDWAAHLIKPEDWR